VSPVDGTRCGMPTPAEVRARHRMEALIGIAGGDPVCVCCGERRVWALVFDHIDGGGVAHRRSAGGTPTYRLVRAERRVLGEWPRHRFQILCGTCNHGRRVAADDVCPHLKEVIMSPQFVAALKSYAKVFAAAVFALFISDGADVFAVDFSDVRTYLSAGIAAVLPLIVTALDPNDDRFGVGA